MCHKMNRKKNENSHLFHFSCVFPKMKTLLWSVYIQTKAVQAVRTTFDLESDYICYHHSCFFRKYTHDSSVDVNRIHAHTYFQFRIAFYEAQWKQIIHHLQQENCEILHLFFPYTQIYSVFVPSDHRLILLFFFVCCVNKYGCLDCSEWKNFFKQIRLNWLYKLVLKST